MKVTIRFPSKRHKVINRILDIILEYSKNNAVLTHELEDFVYVYILKLRTENEWRVNLFAETLTYCGSRAGFRAGTPFTSQGYEFRVFPDWKVTIYREKWPSLDAEGKIVGYSTSYPELQVTERIVQLPDQPDKGVVLDWDGNPRRVLPYLDVYRTESSDVSEI